MANYSSPITVNGYSCRNCSDVSLAQKRIDPAHPQSGPDGVNAANDPSQPAAVKAKIEQAKALRAHHDASMQSYSAHGQATAAISAGRLVDTQA